MIRDDNGFEHLHSHSEFSLLDGYAKVEEYVARSPLINQHFLCITDHGMMGAIPRQIKCCDEMSRGDFEFHKGEKLPAHSLSPIFGCELYVKDKYYNEEERKLLSPEDTKLNRKAYHLLAIAYNMTGYKNLVQLSSKGWTQFYFNPRVTHAQLLEHKEGIIFTSCCYIGEIGQAFDRGGPDEAEDMLVKYHGMFGENFYLEFMLLDFNKQKPYNAWLIKMHDKHKIPMIVTNDCFVEGTMITTQRGSIPIEKIEIGDKVLTHNGRWRAVEFVNSRQLQENEKVYRIKARLGSYAFEATGNHPIEIDGKWIEVKNLEPGMKLKINRPQNLLAEEDLQVIDLFEVLPEKLISHYEKESQSFVTYRGTDKRNTVTIPRFLPITDDFLRMIGYYTAEGSITYSSEVSFASHINEQEQRKLLEIYFSNFKINVSIDDRGENGKATRFSSVIWNPILESLVGKGSCKKKLFGIGKYKISNRQMGILLDCYFQGDGSHSKQKFDNFMIASTSIGLIEDVRSVLAFWGIPVARTHRKYDKNKKHKNPNARPEKWNTLYVLNISGKKKEALKVCLTGKIKDFGFDFSSQIKSITPIEYSKSVFNLQVAEDETYTANGWSVHNCHYCNKEDSKYQRYMLMIQKKSTIKDIQAKLEAEGEAANIFEMQDANLWKKSEAEMNAKWLEMYSDVIPLEIFEEAKRNTVRICHKAKGVVLDREAKLPQVPNEKEEFSEALLRGMKWRGVYGKKEYMARMYEEFDLIYRKGFASYFLIQKKFTDEARRVCPEFLGWGTGHEAVGPGRGCTTFSTPVLMASGRTKPIGEIVPGDLVFDKAGNKQVVDKTYEYDHSGSMVQIKCYYGNSIDGVTLTPDHMVWCEKMIRPKNYHNWAESTKKARKSIEEPTGDFKWLPAGEVEVGDWVWMPKIKTQVEDLDAIDLMKYASNQRHKCDDGWIYVNSKRHERFIEQDEDWMRVLGVFTGDGWLETHHTEIVCFCFNSETDLESMDFVISFFQKKGFKLFVKKDGDKKVFVCKVFSKLLRNLFREMFCDYKDSCSKHIPRFVFNAKDNLKESFLKGYFLSDGSQGENKLSFTTCSKRLAEEVRFLLLGLNIPSSLSHSIRIDPRSGYEGDEYVVRLPSTGWLGEKHHQKKYVFRSTDDGMMLRVREVNKVENVKKVYDFSAPASENYLTDSFAVHNSGVGSLCNYVLGITDVDPIKHGLLFSRFLSEARGGKSLKTRFTKPPLPILEIV